jgi:hypothetical protein
MAEEDTELAETSEALHQALQAHLSAVLGPRVVTGYTICAEVVDGDGEVDLVPVVSPGMPAWRRIGFASYGQALLLGVL